MMKAAKAQISQKVLRKIKLAHVPVVDADGEVSSVQYTEINGALLVPVGDAQLFNTSTSTIRREISRGNLLPYHDNGTIKTDNRSTKVYFDLYAWMDLDKNQL